MLRLLKGGQPPLAAASDADLAALATPGGRSHVDMIDNFSGQACALCQEGASVEGAIDDTDWAAGATNEAVRILATCLDAVEASQAVIDAESRGSQLTLADARRAVEDVGGAVLHVVELRRGIA